MDMTMSVSPNFWDKVADRYAKRPTAALRHPRARVDPEQLTASLCCAGSRICCWRKIPG